MKKLFLSMVLVIGAVAVASAAVQPPLDLRGNPLYTSDFVGVLPFNINNSTGTTAVLVASGRGEVFGVVISSDAITNYAAFRDSNTANTSSPILATVFNQGNGTTQVVPGTVMQVFPRPIQFTNGLSVNLFAAPPAGVQSNWTILYRPLKATE